MRTREEQELMIDLRHVAGRMYQLINKVDNFINNQDEEGFYLVTVFSLRKRRDAMAALFEKIDALLVKGRVHFPYTYTFAHNGETATINTQKSFIQAIQLDLAHFDNFFSGYQTVFSSKEKNQEKEKKKEKHNKKKKSLSESNSSIALQHLFCQVINIGSSDSSSSSESSRLADDAKSSNSLSQ